MKNKIDIVFNGIGTKHFRLATIWLRSASNLSVGPALIQSLIRCVFFLCVNLRITVCSVRHLVNTHTPTALQRTFQALYLLHKALHSGRRHVTFCCIKSLNRTFLLSSLTRPCFYLSSIVCCGPSCVK